MSIPFSAPLGAALGWGLAVAAVAVGYVAYGWPGVLLAVSMVVFWLLLQLSRAMRALRQASGRPVGSVDSAVMLQARLSKGLRLTQVLALTRSLGARVAEDPETFAWTDASGARVQVVFVDGRCSHWALQRPPGTDAAA